MVSVGRLSLDTVSRFETVLHISKAILRKHVTLQTKV